MKMKNFAKVLTVILLCAMLAPALIACGASEKVIIGVTDFPPMNYKDDKGKWIGFESEFAEAVCKKIGVTAEFQIIDWSAKETELNAGNIDCIWNGMTVTPERAENMSLSQHYMINRQVLVTLAENEDKYQAAADFNGAAVVAEAGSTGEETAQGDAFFAGAKYTAVDSQIKALMEVKAGTADVAVVDYFIAANSTVEGSDFANLVISKYKTFADEEYAIAFRKVPGENEKITVDQVNKAINELIGSGELQKIADKYGLGDLLIKG